MTGNGNCRKIQPLVSGACAALSVLLTRVSKVIEVSVNGAAQRFEPDTDIAAMLERMQLTGKRVAVERNGEIVPRSRFAQTSLADGDRLEIVVAVGGG